MPQGVETDGGLSLWRLGAGALLGVPAVGLSLLVARHDIDPLRSIRVENVNRIVGQTYCTSSPIFLSTVPVA